MPSPPRDVGSDSPFAAEGSLREMKGRDIGTRQDIDLKEIMGKRLLDTLSIRLTLQTFETNATLPNRPPQSSVELNNSPFSQFISDVSLAQGILDRISQHIKSDVAWGITIRFETNNSTVTDLLPRDPARAMGLFRPDFRMSPADFLAAVDIGWKSLQWDLWTEMEFRTRYRIASKHASAYCRTQNWGWSRGQTQAQLSQLWRDILPLYRKLIRTYELRSDKSRDPDELNTTAAYMNLAWMGLKTRMTPRLLITCLQPCLMPRGTTLRGRRTHQRLGLGCSMLRAPRRTWVGVSERCCGHASKRRMRGTAWRVHGEGYRGCHQLLRRRG